MSDTVKITVITEQSPVEPSKPGEGKHGKKDVIATHPTGKTLMSTLLGEKLIDGSFCGGRGDCGRCVVQFVEGATLPTGIERSVMKPEELRDGYRLACMSRPKQDCVIRLALRSVKEADIVTHTDPMMRLPDKIDYIGQYTADNFDDRHAMDQFVDHQPGSKAKVRLKSESEGMKRTSPYIMAVDLGTTTVAMQLVETVSGRIVDTCAGMNPQRRFGADVLSRIQAASEGHAQELKDCLWQVLEEGLEQFAQTLWQIKRQAETDRTATVQAEASREEAIQAEASRIDVIPDIGLISIAGNTTMEHLLMGLPTASLGRNPFTPVDIGLQKTEWKGIPVYVLPGISAFVGGDIVAGLYACGMLGNKRMYTDRSGSPDQSDSWDCPKEVKGTALLIDLGTNGEMVLQKGDRMIAAATAAGPAFEGGVGNAVIGSDMIAIADALLSQGIMDESGLLKEPYFTEGISINKRYKEHYAFTPGKDGQALYMTKEDIRSLQMAKAAVRTGIELLAKRLYCDEKREIKVYLAGGFGYYLHVDAAIRTGLLPKSLQGRVLAAGNTSLAGAYLLGRALWLGMIEVETLQEELTRIESINLANQEDFEKSYIGNMNFEMK